MSTELNIYQRINEVRKEVEYVQKDATVNAGGSSYKAVTHDMVTAVVRPLLIKHGIVITVDQLQSRLLQEKAVKADGDKGYKMHLYSGDYAVHFVNIDNPGDRISVTVNAQANDSGDKAPGKAMSYATKYAILKTFSLETGENEEARFAEPYSSEQFEVYHDLVERKAAYEFFMFVAALPAETQTGLYNSFPDGKKSQGKKAVNELTQEGQEAFEGMVLDVQQRLSNQDASVIEVTDEMSATEKSLLASRLTEFEVNQLSKFKKAAA